MTAGASLRLRCRRIFWRGPDPPHLGTEIGIFSVLHTRNQKLEHHPYVHPVVSEGGLASDGTRLVRPRYNLFLPVNVPGRVFRDKFVAGLR